MTAYAVAHLRKVDLGPEIFDYIARIDATLDPFGGRFLIHGGPVDPMDGNWSGDLVVIEFQNRGQIVDGLPEGYRAADKLAKLMPAAAA